MSLPPLSPLARSSLPPTITFFSSFCLYYISSSFLLPYPQLNFKIAMAREGTGEDWIRPRSSVMHVDSLDICRKNVLTLGKKTREREEGVGRGKRGREENNLLIIYY